MPSSPRTNAYPLFGTSLMIVPSIISPKIRERHGRALMHCVNVPHQRRVIKYAVADHCSAVLPLLDFGRFHDADLSPSWVLLSRNAALENHIPTHAAFRKSRTDMLLNFRRFKKRIGVLDLPPARTPRERDTEVRNPSGIEIFVTQRDSLW